VPLYCCDVCGWATTAFRVDAVREHHNECRSCVGTMRLAFDLLGRAPPEAILPAEPESEPARAVDRYLRPRVERRGRPTRIEGVLGPQRRSFFR
jgi:hypothetical protein